jgi:hypothetical protein
MTERQELHDLIQRAIGRLEGLQDYQAALLARDGAEPAKEEIAAPALTETPRNGHQKHTPHPSHDWKDRRCSKCLTHRLEKNAALSCPKRNDLARVLGYEPGDGNGHAVADLAIDNRRDHDTNGQPKLREATPESPMLRAANEAQLEAIIELEADRVEAELHPKRIRRSAEQWRVIVAALLFREGPLIRSKIVEKTGMQYPRFDDVVSGHEWFERRGSLDAAWHLTTLGHQMAKAAAAKESGQIKEE